MRLINADSLEVELECTPFYKCNSGIMRQLGERLNKPVTFSEKETLLKWKDILAVLDESPTIEAEPVRHGRWALVGADKRGRGGVYNCTACNACRPVKSKYCPDCGAKMDAKEE